jgi:hypothetical protein
LAHNPAPHPARYLPAPCPAPYVPPRESFHSLGERVGTDKVTHHQYCRFYPQFLDRLRDSPGAILEIGIDKLHSLNLWLQYFSKAFIYGIDIGFEHHADRTRVFKGDQSSKSDLVRIRGMMDRPVFLIVDDGSHIPEHQVDTFEYLFRDLLQPGGVYIVEDTETSYWKRGAIYGYPTAYGYKQRDSFIERVKPLADAINAEFLSAEAKAENAVDIRGISTETARMISSMTFGQNCVVFVKKPHTELNTPSRAYRFSQNI